LYGSGINSDDDGDIKYVRIFLAIAAIILLIAGINYMNLTTALGLRRTKEVGIKKAVGQAGRCCSSVPGGESRTCVHCHGPCHVFVELFLPESISFRKTTGNRIFEPVVVASS